MAPLISTLGSIQKCSREFAAQRHVMLFQPPLDENQVQRSYEVCFLAEGIGVAWAFLKVSQTSKCDDSHHILPFYLVSYASIQNVLIQHFHKPETPSKNSATRIMEGLLYMSY